MDTCEAGRSERFDCLGVRLLPYSAAVLEASDATPYSTGNVILLAVLCCYHAQVAQAALSATCSNDADADWRALA